MQLIAALVYVAPFGHEGADIVTQFLDALRQLPAVISHGRRCNEGRNLISNDKDFLFAHRGEFSNTICKDIKKKLDLGKQIDRNFCIPIIIHLFCGLFQLYYG
jgi:hypothetical protein